MMAGVARAAGCISLGCTVGGREELKIKESRPGGVHFPDIVRACIVYFARTSSSPQAQG